MDIEAFSWQYLFESLGIERPPWQWIGDSGVIYAGGDQQLTPGEMLKFGVTYLDGGAWDGQKIVVFPDQNAVVVFTEGNYTSADSTAKILMKNVIPAFD